MGAARKVWQAAKARCPDWDRDARKKDDLGPTLDKLEDAIADLSSTAGKVKDSAMKTREAFAKAQGIGQHYSRAIDLSASPHKLHFRDGISAAVDQLAKRYADLAHEKLREAVRELSDVKDKLDRLR